jgi:hypothetical protein
MPFLPRIARVPSVYIPTYFIQSRTFVFTSIKGLEYFLASTSNNWFAAQHIFMRFVVLYFTYENKQPAQNLYFSRFVQLQREKFTFINYLDQLIFCPLGHFIDSVRDRVIVSTSFELLSPSITPTASFIAGSTKH